MTTNGIGQKPATFSEQDYVKQIDSLFNSVPAPVGGTGRTIADTITLIKIQEPFDDLKATDGTSITGKSICKYSLAVELGSRLKEGLFDKLLRVIKKAFQGANYQNTVFDLKSEVQDKVDRIKERIYTPKAEISKELEERHVNCYRKKVYLYLNQLSPEKRQMIIDVLLKSPIIKGIDSSVLAAPIKSILKSSNSKEGNTVRFPDEGATPSPLSHTREIPSRKG